METYVMFTMLGGVFIGVGFTLAVMGAVIYFLGTE